MTAKRGGLGFIVAAPQSGAGKTTIALGIMSALKRRGLTVQPFKCGPDYIEPAFHMAATGRASFNLDTWSMRRELIGDIVRRAAADADISVVEGVMGLFDGAAEGGRSGTGSTADVAALTGWPVVLVLDVSAQAETAAAVALGCRAYRDDIRLAGVILNRVASLGHERLIRAVMERIGLPVLGSVFMRDSLELPDRHLGLVQAGELAGLEDYLDALSEVIAAGVSMDDLIPSAEPVALSLPAGGATAPFPPPGQRIALAQDRAFSFTYPHVLEGWRSAGAEILPFSPLADEAPDATADAIWLPGGYPELHAGAIAGADRFLAGLKQAASRGAQVHGECGGYMVLGAGLEDADGRRHSMAGLLGLETTFAKRKLHLGYRRATLVADCALGSRQSTLFGHEFHFATVLEAKDEPLLYAVDFLGAETAERGSRRGAVTGTFFHVIDRED